MTIKPIVVGVDGSAAALRAVEWAAREAALRGAPLRIVSAAEILPRMTMPPQAVEFDTVAARIRQSRDWALGTAARAGAVAAPGLQVDTEPLEGPPAQAVTDSGSGALMLVVGSQGKSAVAALALGSVSRYAALHASCPVVVVREEAMAAHHLVVVGIRDPGDCAAALAFAFEEARLRKARLLAVHAWQSPDPRVTDTRAVGELAGLLDDWQGKFPDVDTRHDVVHGHPGRVLADLSRRADLVVLGRHAAIGRMLPGPARTAHAVVSHAHSPVVTVPSD